MNSTWRIIAAKEVSRINNNPVWQYNYRTITCRSESVLLGFSSWNPMKRYNWNKIRLQCGRISCPTVYLTHVFVRKYGAWWFNAENENGVVFFKFTRRYCMCHKQQCSHSANKRKGSHSRHEPLPSPSPCKSVHAALHSAVSCQALKIVALTTEVRINSSIQAHTNNQKITCNPRYTAGMPITLDLSK